MTALDPVHLTARLLRASASRGITAIIRGASIATLFAALLPVVLSVACSADTGAAAVDPIAEDVSAPASSIVLDSAALTRAGIATEAAREEQRQTVTTAPGLVALNDARTARIGSLVDGVVTDISVGLGERVRANQLLASLHSHAVHDSWAGYRKAKADERRLTNELAFVSDALARAERLYAAKAISLQELQRVQANRVSAAEALDIGRTEVRRSEEELEHLGITNGDDPSGEAGEQIPVRTPFGGVVIERLVTNGTALIPGTALFVVSDLSSVWVLAELDEAHVGAARLGQPVTVRVPAYPNDAFEGTVTYIAEMVNPKTRRVTIRCEVPNRDGRLKPEMYATVDIGERESKTVTVLPSSAVQTINGQASVFVKEGDGRFTQKPVVLGADRDGVIEVREGVRPGDIVVTAGAFVLKSELLKSAMGGE